MKHYIDFHEDVGIEELNYLLDIAADMKKKTKTGIEHHYLKGKSLGMIFTKSSTRTRVSFAVVCTSSADRLSSFLITTFRSDAARPSTIRLTYCPACSTVS